MTDLAKLTIQINTSGAKTAAANLGEVKQAAADADAAVRGLGAIDDAAFNKLANALASVEGGSFTTFTSKVSSAESSLRTALAGMAGQGEQFAKVAGFFGQLTTAALDTAGALELVKNEAGAVNIGKAARDLSKFADASAKTGNRTGPAGGTKGLDGLATSINKVGDAALDAGIALLDFQKIELKDDVAELKEAFVGFRTELRNLFTDINRLSKVLGVMPRALAPIKTAFDGMATAMNKARDGSDGLARRIGSIESNAKKLDGAADVARTGLGELEVAFDRTKEAALQYKNGLSGATSTTQASGRARQLQKDIAGVGIAASRTNTQLRNAAGGVTLFGNASRTAGNFAKQFATGLGFIGPAFAAAIGAREAVSTITDFEYSLAALQAVAIDANATFGEQIDVMGKLEAQARRLGAATRFTATETAEAQLFLARAGFESNEILAATPATLDLAAAGMLDLGNAADIASNVLQQFSLDAGQLTQVSDDLVSAANNSNTTVEQLAAALSYAGPFAASLGITVNEAAAAIGALGNAGIKATLAGTNFRGILVGLTKPTKEASDTMDVLAKRIGTTREAFDITERSVEEVFQSFKDANASAQELASIFNRRNVSGAQAFITQIDSLKALNATLSDNTGEARRAADIVDNSLRGAYRRAVSAAEEFVLVQGDNGVRGALRGTVDALADAFRLLSGIKQPTDEAAAGAKGLVLAFQALTGAVLGLGLGLVVKGVVAVGSSMVTAATAATGLRAALIGVSTAFPPLLLASIAGSVLVMAYNFLTAKENVRDLSIEAGKLEGVFRDLLPALDTVGDAIKKAFKIDPQDDPTKSITATANAIQQVDDALKQLADQQSGRNTEGSGIPIAKLTGITPELTALAVEQADAYGNTFVSKLQAGLEDQQFRKVFTNAIRGADDIQELEAAVNKALVGLDVSSGFSVLLQDGVKRSLLGGRVDEITRSLRQIAPDVGVDASSAQLATFASNLNELFKAAANSNLDGLANDVRVGGDLIQRAARSAGISVTKSFADELATASSRGSLDTAVIDVFRDLGRNLENSDLTTLPLDLRVDRKTATEALKAQREVLTKLQGDAKSAQEKLDAAIRAGENDTLLNNLLDERDARLEAVRIQGEAIGMTKQEAAIFKAVSTERRKIEGELRAAVEKGAITRAQSYAIIEESVAKYRAELEKQAAAEANVAAIQGRTDAYDKLLGRLEKQRVASDLKARSLELEVAGQGKLAAAEEQGVKLKSELQALQAEGIKFTEDEITALEKKAQAVAENNEREREAKAILGDRSSDDKVIATIEKTIEKRRASIAEMEAERDGLSKVTGEVERSIEKAQLSANATDDQRKSLEELKQTLRELGVDFAALQAQAGDAKIIASIEAEIAKRREAIDVMRAENNLLSSNGSEVERFINNAKLSKDATAEQRAEFEKLVTTLRGLGITYGQVADQSDKLKQQQQLASSFNTTLASGFTNIITAGDGAKDAVKNLYQQLIQMVLNQQILSILQGAGGPSGGAGGFLAGLFGGANYNGGVFSGGSVKQYAKGGIPDFKQLPDIGSNFSFFRSGDGKMNSIRERGPEAIMPLARDANGRLGVRTNGGGQGPSSQTNTINHVQNVTSYNVEAAPDGFGMNSRQMNRQMRRRRN
jgi:TP901 family phage tail tape measure protein